MSPAHTRQRDNAVTAPSTTARAARRVSVT